MKKIIYWRWREIQGTIIKSYIQKDLGDMFELNDSQWETQHPTRVLKKEIEIIKIKEPK